MPRSAQELVSEYKLIYERADQEDRDLTQAERSRVADLVEAARSQKAIEDGMRELGPAAGPGFTDPSRNSSTSGPGDVFVASEKYKAIRAADLRPQQWTTGPVPVSNISLSHKGTLLESGAGGPGGGLVPPGYEPGVVSRLFEPVGDVTAAFGASQTVASQVRYAIEGTATSGAAVVAEAGLKPESSLGYSEVVEPVKKVATFLPVSDEMIEDAPSIQGYLNSRLQLFVRIEQERQLLRGAGTNELVGLFNRSGNQAINTYSRGTDDNTVAILKVLVNTRGSSNLTPDLIVLHPSNWLSTRLLRDGTGGTAGAYLGGGPFGQPYGGPSAGVFQDALWNTSVVLSSVVGAGTALIGNFRDGAHIWYRGGLNVEASNSHQDFFQRDLTAIRAETRLALGLYRPSAFTALTGLT